MGEELFNIVISEKVERELWKPWWRSLIVKLLGRKISYPVMKRRLEIMWGRFGGIDVIDLGNDFYLVKFYAQEDLDHALLDGPWKIYDHYLAVRLWEPNFNPLLTFIDKITAWIRLPGLPIELGKFARLCVEVDLTKPLLEVYMINGKFYQIEYEGIHQLCFLCGKIDHEQKQCTLGKEIDSERGQHIQVRDENHKETSMQQAEGQNTHGMDAKVEEARRKEKGKETIQHTSNNFGPWMIVQKQRRSRRANRGRKQKRGAASSAFRRTFKELLKQYKADIVVLMETRISGDNARNAIRNMGFNHFIIEEAQGFAGGIWICWNNDNLKITKLESHS
nr:uncharacterized protein LOC112748247 [Arachis hypogaea]